MGVVDAALLAFLLVVGTYDLLQRRHSVLRNYPVLGQMRYLPHHRDPAHQPPRGRINPGHAGKLTCRSHGPSNTGTRHQAEPSHIPLCRADLNEAA
ncbi:hypothetical protein [Antrihabitans stalactiti]|uniref:hypothetical protein n=1 Tax=Antrihabitans stalactiti TaxID=2584121 RepID=UPI001F0D0E09|nr:hypothetical protein [Antrihabitans stalactiti]